MLTLGVSIHGREEELRHNWDPWRGLSHHRAGQRKDGGSLLIRRTAGAPHCLTVHESRSETAEATLVRCHALEQQWQASPAVLSVGDAGVRTNMIFYSSCSLLVMEEMGFGAKQMWVGPVTCLSRASVSFSVK